MMLDRESSNITKLAELERWPVRDTLQVKKKTYNIETAEIEKKGKKQQEGNHK